MKFLPLVAVVALLFSACGAKDDVPAGGGTKIVNPATCAEYKTTADVEAKLILPRCGKTGGCHGDIFPPMFKTAAMLEQVWVDKVATLQCMKDKYINKADPAKSFVLAKIKGNETNVTCPSGGTGGLRMPNAPELPLTDAEAQCLTWYVYEMAAR